MADARASARTHAVAVSAGDVFVIETPGGGGCGKADAARAAAE